MKVYHYYLNEFDNLLCKGFEVELICDLTDILTNCVKPHLRSERGVFDVELSIFNSGHGYYLKKLNVREERMLKEKLKEMLEKMLK
jgi:hypothetical protein